MNDDLLMTLVFEVSTDAKLIVKQNGIIFKINRAATKLFSKSKEELEGKSLWKILKGKSKKTFKPFFSKGTNEKNLHQELSIFINGENKVLDVIGNFFISKDLHLLIIRDVTENVAYMESREKLVSIAGHELKTPIAVILAYADLLKRRCRDDGVAQKYLKKISEKSGTLTNYINEILDEIRFGTGKINFNESVEEFDKIVETTVDEIRTAFPKVKLSLRGKTNQKMLLDKVRISQVVKNLIINAIDYTTMGKDIEINLKNGDDSVLFTIKDQGIGISKKDQKFIFRAFYRSVNSKRRHKSGMGLGLYIAKQIVSNYGGNIGVNSKLGKGSEFYFDLPVVSLKPEKNIRKKEVNSLN